jgi:hypothetical protein
MNSATSSSSAAALRRLMGGEHIFGVNNVMGWPSEITNASCHEDEIKYTNLRQRASINRNANGDVQP